MMNLETVRSNLNTINLLGERSQVRAVRAVREKVEKSSDPLRAANSIITMFGCVPVDDSKSALIKAQAVVLAAQQAAITGKKLNEEELNVIGDAKVKDILSEFPVVIARNTDNDSASIKPRGKRGAKRERAIELYNTHSNKPIKTIAVTLSEEMGISLANAYTYVYNVRKILGLETSSRGRKSKTSTQ